MDEFRCVSWKHDNDLNRALQDERLLCLSDLYKLFVMDAENVIRYARVAKEQNEEWENSFDLNLFEARLNDVTEVFDIMFNIR